MAKTKELTVTVKALTKVWEKGEKKAPGDEFSVTIERAESLKRSGAAEIVDKKVDEDESDVS